MWEAKTRPLRRHYCHHGTNGLLYVVDSNSQELRVDRGRGLMSFHRCSAIPDQVVGATGTNESEGAEDR